MVTDIRRAWISLLNVLHGEIFLSRRLNLASPELIDNDSVDGATDQNSDISEVGREGNLRDEGQAFMGLCGAAIVVSLGAYNIWTGGPCAGEVLMSAARATSSNLRFFIDLVDINIVFV